MAEYYYFSGQAEKAMKKTELYLSAADKEIRLSTCWIFAYSCLTMGRIDHARHALQEIQNTLANDGKTKPSVHAVEAFVAFEQLCFCTCLCQRKCHPLKNSYLCWHQVFEHLHYMCRLIIFI